MASVGSRGDSYDNALAETVNGLFKAELVGPAGPWRTVAALELAIARWVEWWNNKRIHSWCGFVSPAEFEAAFHARQTGQAAA